MKQIYINQQYFEKVTSRKEAGQYIKDIKSDARDCTEWQLPEGSQLWVKYTDGSEIVVGDCDSMEKVKISNVFAFIYSAEWGEAFYNAFPELDKFNYENCPDLWLIRIACEPGEYGEAVDLESLQLETLAEQEEREETSDGEPKEEKHVHKNLKNFVLSLALAVVALLSQCIDFAACDVVTSGDGVVTVETGGQLYTYRGDTTAGNVIAVVSTSGTEDPRDDKILTVF